jgi:ABC-2 type transport system permease protein
MSGTFRYLRLLRAFVVTELQFEMQYRVNFLFVLLEMGIVIGTSVAAVLVMFEHTDTLNGWTFPQMLVLLGVFYLVQGTAAMVFDPSFQRLMEHIRLGTLDYQLLKPVNAQFIVSVRHLKLVRLPDTLLGVVILGIGLARTGEGVSLVEISLFATALLCGLTLVYALLLGLVTLSFWFVRVENVLNIFWAFTDAGRFPVGIYPGWLRWTLSTIVPVGIAVTVPAEAIAGRTGLGGVSLLALGAAAAAVAASAFWRVGVRNYTGASA